MSQKREPYDVPLDQETLEFHKAFCSFLKRMAKKNSHARQIAIQISENAKQSMAEDNEPGSPTRRAAREAKCSEREQCARLAERMGRKDIAQAIRDRRKRG